MADFVDRWIGNLEADLFRAGEHMTAKKLWSAGISFAITLGTSLMTLWTADTVVNFGDVAPVAYGTAFIGAAIGAAKDLQSSLRDSRK